MAGVKLQHFLKMKINLSASDSGLHKGITMLLNSVEVVV